MKKLIITFLIISIALFATACSTSNDMDAELNELLDEIVASQANTDNSALAENEIDYTPYANLVNTYFETYGELIVEQHYADGGINTAGFNYAELIDLDNNGVLELVLAGVSDDMNSIENGTSAIDLYFGEDYSLKETVEIYTLSESGEAVLLATQTFSSYGNGGVEFGIDYAKSADTTYILNSFRSNEEAVTYYELSGGKLIESLKYELIFDYDNDEFTALLNGQESETAAIEDALALKGEVVFNKVSWLSQQELDELIARNEEAFLFLEQYAPINRLTA